MTSNPDDQNAAARPMVAPDTNRELLAAQQRIDARTAQMAELNRQPRAVSDTGQQPGGFYDLDAQNKLEDWRMTRGYLDTDGVVRLPSPTTYLDELTGDAPGTWAAKNMTATQTNAAMRPYLAESMELSGAKQMQARVDAGQMTPADAEAERELVAGVTGMAMMAGRRGSKANPNRPPSPVQLCPPSEPILLSKRRFGHTFERHGQDATAFGTNRARAMGQPNGQFLDDQAAARFIVDNLDKVKNGAVSLPIPANLPARIINPDGTFSPATSVRLIPGGGGVRSAYPE